LAYRLQARAGKTAGADNTGSGCRDVLVKRPATRKRARGQAPGARSIGGTRPTHDAMEAELADLRGKRIFAAYYLGRSTKKGGDRKRSGTLVTAVVE
jgi:hypothetical protein